MHEEIHQAILELYRQVDAAVAAAGPVCVSSGKCCRFEEYGHRLYLSNLEAEVLLAAAPPYEQPVSASFCPFQKENLCTAREPRPLGCRIFYCDPAYQETSHQLMEKSLAQLKELAAAHELEWKYAPLHYFLKQAKPRTAQPSPDIAPEPERNYRLALPVLSVTED